MTDHDPFATPTSRRWSEVALDVMVPAAAAILTVVVLAFLTRSPRARDPGPARRRTALPEMAGAARGGPR